MLLLNVCVFDTCCLVTLLTWTILQSNGDRLSLTDFYERVSQIIYIKKCMNGVESGRLAMTVLFSL